MKLNLKKLIVGIGAVVLMTASISFVRSEWTVRNLIQSQGQRDDSSPRIPQDSVTAGRWRRLDMIWQMRTKNDAAGQVLPFLADPFPPLRVRATQILGKLEDPTAEVPLQTILERMKSEDDGYKTGGIPRLTVQLALGRIRSRSLRGQAKVAAMVKQVGLTWPEMVRLSQKVNSMSRLERQQTSGNKIVEEVVDLLNMMGRKGEDTHSLANQLSLTPAQQVMVQVSFLPVDQEINTILNSFSQFNVFIDSDILVNHLLYLNPRAGNLVVKRLQDVKAHPERYRKTSVQSFGLLFRTAVQLDAPRVLPLLKKFEIDPKPWPGLRQQAQIAKQVTQTQITSAPNLTRPLIIPRE